MLYLLLVAIVNLVLGYALAAHLGYGPPLRELLASERLWELGEVWPRPAASPADMSEPSDVQRLVAGDVATPAEASSGVATGIDPRGASHAAVDDRDVVAESVAVVQSPPVDITPDEVDEGELDESIANFKDDLQRYREQLVRVDARLSDEAVKQPATGQTTDDACG